MKMSTRKRRMHKIRDHQSNSISDNDDIDYYVQTFYTLLYISIRTNPKASNRAVSVSDIFFNVWSEDISDITEQKSVGAWSQFKRLNLKRGNTTKNQN